MNVDDLIAGIACVEVCRLDDIAIPMRALAEAELADIDALARAAASLLLPGEPVSGVTTDARWPLIVARAALDPGALRGGLRMELWTATEAASLAPADVDALLIAQQRAQRRAAPFLTEDETRDAIDALHERAQRLVLRTRAQHGPIADFFGVASSRHVTDWQAIYFQELTR